ncbi:Alpha-(1,3)-fucosyltransferase 11 [Podila humilis]|nr:Alpha-(1,3)-fucosyltransferase 11 [Podila humilis]
MRTRNADNSGNNASPAVGNNAPQNEMSNTHQSDTTPEQRPNYPILWWTDVPEAEQKTLSSSKNNDSNRSNGSDTGDSMNKDDDGCGVPYTCTWTQDRALMDQTTVVVFAGGAAFRASDPLPPTPRNNSQAWVLYTVPPSAAIQNPEMDEILPSLGLTHSWSNSPLADFVQETFMDIEQQQAKPIIPPISASPVIVASLETGTSQHAPPPVVEGSKAAAASGAGAAAPEEEAGGEHEKRQGIGAWPILVSDTESNENDRKDNKKNTERALLPFLKSSLTPASTPTSLLEAIAKDPWVELVEKNRLRKLGKEEGGKSAVAWIVRTSTHAEAIADCSKPSHSGRENYVQELLKVMDVDIYGDCMSNTAWPIHKDTQKLYTDQELIADYKFYLALESVACDDYVSSDLVQALVVGTVPIVDGPKDYTRFSPGVKALIRVDSFIAPELLAQELNALDQDDIAYMAHLDYREIKSRGDRQRVSMSPQFIDTFKDRSYVSLSSPSSNMVIAEDNNKNNNNNAAMKKTFPKDRHGARCSICQLAHELATTQYDWSSIDINSITNRIAVCEREPRYLPGLPAQMTAYEEYLRKEQENHSSPSFQGSSSTLLESAPNSNASIPITDTSSSSNAHSVNVTVTLHSDNNNNNNSDTDANNNNNSQDAWINPSVHIEQENDSPLSLLSSSIIMQQQGEAKPLLAGDLTTTTVKEDGIPVTSSPPPLEMIYLALLILVLLAGVVALLLVLSKQARQFVTWPFRHLFYKKLPQQERGEARRREQMSLERIMLSELGEDLLYD